MTTTSRGGLLWIAGLPSSGKSTFARVLKERLDRVDLASCILDGDEVRAALHPAPGYTAEAREAFYETLTDLAVLLARQDLIVIVAATAGRNAYRERARQLGPRYLEVEIATPLQECERRDSKGLYAKARAGLVQDVPGIDAPYERQAADVVAAGGHDTQALEQVLVLLYGRIPTLRTPSRRSPNSA
jgi:adenylylsulfate kinase